MSLGGLLIGIFFQLMFAVFQFTAVVFAAGAAVNGGKLAQWQITIIGVGNFLIPAMSVVISILLIVLYKINSPYLTNWWHGVPFITFPLYLAYVLKLTGK